MLSALSPSSPGRDTCASQLEKLVSGGGRERTGADLQGM